MDLTVNGERRACAAATTLSALIAALNLDSAAIVAEVSGAIVTPDKFAATILADHDVIELVRFVGGG